MGIYYRAAERYLYLLATKYSQHLNGVPFSVIEIVQQKIEETEPVWMRFIVKG